MYKIVGKRALAPQIFLMDIEAPRVAKSAKPGQFVIIKMDEKGERIPLTISNYDATRGTVTIVVQTIGCSTKEMENYNIGDSFSDFVGPLGQASELMSESIEDLKKKKIVFVAGGLGTAPVYPQVKWLSEQGVKVDVIIGAKAKDYVIMEEEMKEVAGNVYPCTDDGSYGYKGLVTNKLKELVENDGIKYDLVVAIGPMIMMKFVCKLTEELGISTIVSMNPIMVDGTGMCGACRLTVDGETKFACVDGPEFDGHKVNFDEAMRRQSMYKTQESSSGEGIKAGCGLGGTK
ncbi:sulfide/dihydroorotate dehydrogenase-like FAD/NAD-binding protein [Clostridium lacusfryxellense]|uniref:sulfide/dihydroorotate dehydrogenase-like FAD/NAD-binding protein n=1 Tax=Clostridium lacusfryxellense TaxID=205328 RepID=UPI001C0CDFC9|nr:sulfide/dihydroorotate dehydrogenase-like FAD/NAD-binding protein [Clostridium lacusfryxellense]MBU3114326.1 sulfide/dihydroorotate dehydrogenase-like FAD/NAD-binding protein [Clostridium lacusfryxellense]